MPGRAITSPAPAIPDAPDAPGIAALWPPAALRLRATVRGHDVELRWPSETDLAALARATPSDHLADPALPGGGPVARSVLRHVWRAGATMRPTDWRLCLVVVLDGEVVGEQDLDATDFPLRLIVETSSWLAVAYRGRGLAKVTRAMVLHLAFDSLGAVAAESQTAEGNDAALGVTRSLGYTPSGDVYALHGGSVEHMLSSRLTRERWALLRQGYGLGAVDVHGVGPCRELLGSPPRDTP